MSTDRRTWKDFSDAGLLWWINRILHTFGWSIITVCEEDGSISDVYPARTEWLGFTPEIDEEKLDAFRDHVERPIVDVEDRLREERDRLRNEVVQLRGGQGHDYKPDLSPEKLGERMLFTCSRCGHTSNAPVHPYFGGNAICPG